MTSQRGICPAGATVDCVVCYATSVKSRRIPCGHSACADCLVSWSTRPAGARQPATDGTAPTLTCPVCEAAIEGGLEELSLEDGAAEKVETPAPEVPPCDFCEDPGEPAVVRCEGCGGNYIGEKCLQGFHSKDKFKTHKLEPAVAPPSPAAAPESFRPGGCKAHRGAPLDLYCNECGVAMCARCLAEGPHVDAHTGEPHKCAVLSEKMKEALPEVRRAAAALEERRGALERDAWPLAVAREALEKNRGELREVVKARCASIRVALEQLEARLLADLDAASDRKASRLAAAEELNQSLLPFVAAESARVQALLESNGAGEAGATIVRWRAPILLRIEAASAAAARAAAPSGGAAVTLAGPAEGEIERALEAALRITSDELDCGQSRVEGTFALAGGGTGTATIQLVDSSGAPHALEADEELTVSVVGPYSMVVPCSVEARSAAGGIAPPVALANSYGPDRPASMRGSEIQPASAAKPGTFLVKYKVGEEGDYEVRAAVNGRLVGPAPHRITVAAASTRPSLPSAAPPVPHAGSTPKKGFLGKLGSLI
eukprot:tig00020684_g12870.t1